MIRGRIAQSRSGFKLTALQLNENDIEAACLDVLRVRLWKAFRLQSGTFRSADLKRWIKGEPKGTPDYLVAHKRYPAFLLETKRPGGKLSEIQEYRVWEIQLGYGLAFFKADSARELGRWLDDYERIHDERINRPLASP
jgi:hypothetical protein